MEPVRVIGHGGDTVYFHSDMVLIPSAHVGYFISYNSLGQNVGGGRGEILRTFMNRYFPSPNQPNNVDAGTQKSDGHKASGIYEGTRRGETTFLKLIALFGQFSVSSDEGGILTVEGDKNQSGELKKWKEIAPLVYKEVDGSERIAFRADASGRVREMLPFPAISEGQRVRWYASKSFAGLVIGGSLLLAFLTVFLWPAAVPHSEKISAATFHFEKRPASLLFFTNRLRR